MLPLWVLFSLIVSLLFGHYIIISGNTWLYFVSFHLQSSRRGFIHGSQEHFVRDVQSQLAERPTGGNVSLVPSKLIRQNGLTKESHLQRFIMFQVELKLVEMASANRGLDLTPNKP